MLNIAVVKGNPMHCIAVTTAINMCARGEVSLLLWGNWTLPPVHEGPPLMRGGSLFAGGELRAARRKAQDQVLPNLIIGSL